LIVAVVRLYRQFDDIYSAAIRCTFSQFFLKRLEVPLVHLFCIDRMDVGKLLPLQKDVRSLIASANAIGSNFGVF
jgi:hypothetical protein